MKIKVCGMRYADNIAAVANLNPDFIGFIFYDRSPRSAIGLDPSVVRGLPTAIGRVGVFVNQTAENIIALVSLYKLTHVQLHGDEQPEFCVEIASKTGCAIIKAVAPNVAKAYDGMVDMLLFDTPSPMRGGTGERFDWQLTDLYRGDSRWVLSGGIGMECVEDLIAKDPFAVDLNSRFEIETGRKNVELLEQFINKIKRHEQNK